METTINQFGNIVFKKTPIVVPSKTGGSKYAAT